MKRLQISQILFDTDWRKMEFSSNFIFQINRSAWPLIFLFFGQLFEILQCSAIEKQSEQNNHLYHSLHHSLKNNLNQTNTQSSQSQAVNERIESLKNVAKDAMLISPANQINSLHFPMIAESSKQRSQSPVSIQSKSNFAQRSSNSYRVISNFDNNNINNNNHLKHHQLQSSIQRSNLFRKNHNSSNGQQLNRIKIALLNSSTTTSFSTNGNLTSTQQSTTSNSDDKNWLLTKAWLIDNINRLRRELNELERDYSQHLDSYQRDQQRDRNELIEDIVKLRADHQFLSQQQKQIFLLIKKNHYFRQKSMQSERYRTKIPDSNQQSNQIERKKKTIKRDINGGRKLKNVVSPVSNRIIVKEPFESMTKRNMKEVFAELSSLHDISIILFDGLRKLEKRIEFQEKYSP